ncbi:hypothetical protein MCOR02_006609 [Pyricularia oryzae]|nr:hypothetical protein MCOR02_006609 [Pyricularia oryzae]KAI6307273.1 hypothetical protein MCOR34_007682 [Pyricularia oryzae]KAI6396641.1 hypothetical protein MCOR23_006542 [Pyricularia oryzae]KAI6465098.1 hypothetical protein MCOR17_005144 [Pyricularia oryzae]KAI6498372.1 hypothetical protein MCOR13_006507 [Pyricularia oryzae]
MADFVNHALDGESRVAEIYSAVIICLIAVTVVVLARIYTRLFVVRTFGLDDWTAAISLPFTVACGVVVGVNIKYGSGRHIWTVSIDDQRQYLINFYLSIVLYNISLLFTKASFLLQYYRVLATTKAMKRLYMGFFIAIVFVYIVFLFLAIFPCIPISDFWSFSDSPNCLPNLPSFYAQAVTNIVSDLAIFFLPLPALWKLHINGPQKLVLLSIFSLGLFACIISIIRLTFLADSPDITWDNASASAWSTAEVCIALICASLPSLRPIVGGILPRLASSFGKSTTARSATRKGTSRLQTVTTVTSRKAPTLYPDLEGSVERLNSNEGSEGAPVRSQTFLDDGSDHNGFAMTDMAKSSAPPDNRI